MQRREQEVIEMLHSLNFMELGTFRPSIDVQSYDVYS